MQFSEWEPVYREIMTDLGIKRSSDEASARSLKMLTLNSDLADEDMLIRIIGEEVIVAGGNVSEKDIDVLRGMHKGTALISAGSATDILMSNGIVPDIMVTDLDGNVELQKKASSSGSLTMMHAHGDNDDLIRAHAKDFTGPVMITTQSTPDAVLFNFGGFTDGDRAVCAARHFGAKKIILFGFDFDVPAHKDGADIEMKKRKLRWAKKVIYDMNPGDVTLISR